MKRLLALFLFLLCGYGWMLLNSANATIYNTNAYVGEFYVYELDDSLAVGLVGAGDTIRVDLAEEVLVNVVIIAVTDTVLITIKQSSDGTNYTTALIDTVAATGFQSYRIRNMDLHRWLALTYTRPSVNDTTDIGIRTMKFSKKLQSRNQ